MGKRKDRWVLLILIHAVFFLLRGQIVYSQSPLCNSEDLKALEGFIKGLDSQSISGWVFDGYSDCCGWIGITCDSSFSAKRRVVELKLGSMGLQGGVSSSLSDLRSLTVLDLSNNSLAGAVPPGLFGLPSLEYLNLSQNKFSGGIPIDSRLPSIRNFNVSFNFFNGSHPVLTGAVNLVAFDIASNGFNSPVNASICSESPQLQVLTLSSNKLFGDLPLGLGNCRSLQKLALDLNGISGMLPDDLFSLSSLTTLFLQGNHLSGNMSEKIRNLFNLVQLDISLNNFSGSIPPDAFGNLTKLEILSASSNKLTGIMPHSLSSLSAIKILNLRNNSLGGEISLNFGSMPRLNSIDLGSNQFTGNIPPGLSSCTELKMINLAKNRLTGGIPESFKNLTALSFLSLSNNSLSNIAAALDVLQNCPSLSTLVLTKNFHSERMPFNGIQGFKSVELFVVPYCGLSGPIPSWLGQCTKLRLVDLSWNHFHGSIPPWFGILDSLFYIDLSNNSLTGQIPLSLTSMAALTGDKAWRDESWSKDPPFFSKRNNSTRGLQYNQPSSFQPSLILSNNNLGGPIWPQFGNLTKLHVFDLSKNELSGHIPEELSKMSSLEVLDLSHNKLSGSIPLSLVKLSFLSTFSVADNDLSGPIPTGGQFSTFPNTSFLGNSGLCGREPFTRCDEEGHDSFLSGKRGHKNISVIIGMAFGIGFGTALVLALAYFVVSRAHSGKVEDCEKVVEDSNEYHHDLSGSILVLLFQNKGSREISTDDIRKSTNNFDQANIIGCGGFGLVYKATLPDGRKLAIKKLSSDFGQMEREFQAEVQTLSRAQHKNLVLLLGYCRIETGRLLIYSYMENGSLDYWLHERIDGGSILDWGMRLRIAQGAAEGLAYLHQSCHPHILHRDIKSSNILLDENFEAHLADFGLARLIEPQDTHVTTDLVGTLGYIPPEYGQASIASFKGDVYSFGVVLLELLTGKRPVDICQPKGCRDLISWVSQMKKEKRVLEVFDPLICDKEHEKQLLQVLELATCCLDESPKARPLTQEIVSWLDNVGID